LTKHPAFGEHIRKVHFTHETTLTKDIAMKNKLFSIALLSMFPLYATAGLVDEINKSTGSNIGTKAAELGKEKARAAGNKQIAA
jgi:hypothetical protein